MSVQFDCPHAPTTLVGCDHCLWAAAQCHPTCSGGVEETQAPSFGLSNANARRILAHTTPCMGDVELVGDLRGAALQEARDNVAAIALRDDVSREDMRRYAKLLGLIDYALGGGLMVSWA